MLIVGGRKVVGGGRHLAVPRETPMTNLFLTLLDHLGVESESLGDSTGHLSLS